MVKRHNLKSCQEIAGEKGGECLSENYVNCATKMRWKCSEGHEWETTLSKIKNDGTWCPKCHSNKKLLGLDEAKEIAEVKGGKCLSSSYENAHSKLLFECDNGHRWETTLSILKHNGSWCRKCYDLSNRCTIEEAKTLAQSKGGKCLSTEYINIRENMDWECSEGHIWTTKYDSIKRGKWCPYCPFKSEECCRKIFEKLFSREFPKKRPGFLKIGNNGYTCLELDGYNENLKVAFEYQGGQHYRHISLFHKTKEEFEKLQERDRIKYELCQKEDIKLILVPYKFTHKNEREMEIYVMDQLVSQGIEIKSNIIYIDD